MARKLDSAADRQRQLSDHGESEAGRRSQDRERAVSRRAFVKRGVTAATGLSATAGTVRTTSAERAGIRFHRVLDAVADLGMDPGGDAPIDGAIPTADDGTLIQFPDGTYRFGSDVGAVSFGGRTRGFEGRGDDVTLLASADHYGLCFGGDATAGAFVGNVEIDRTAPNASAGLRLRGDRLVVRDVLIRASDRYGGDRPALSCSTDREDGTLLVESVTTPTGDGNGAVETRPDGITQSSGTVRDRSTDDRDGSDETILDSLRIEGTGVATNYEITVDGSIRREQSGPEYSRSGSNSEGTIETGAVRYAIDGTITDFRLDGAADVYLNSTEIDPAALGGTHHHRLALGADGSTTVYAFAVSQLYPGATSASAERRERRGAVGGSESVETYRFAGDVATLAVRGPATLSFGSGRY